MIEPTSPFIFIIDTDTYAGNFEREMCAYITGCIGDCEVGREMAKLFMSETGLQPFENVVNEMDEHGTYRPVTIFPTPGYFNNGMGAHFKDVPENEAVALAAYVASCKDTYNGYMKAPLNHIEVLTHGTEAQKAALNKKGWTLEAAAKEVQRHKASIAEAEAKTAVSKWPAALSVAISFEKRPTPEQITLMKARAALFADFTDRWGGGKRLGNLLGFRLMAIKIGRTETLLET